MPPSSQTSNYIIDYTKPYPSEVFENRQRPINNYSNTIPIQSQNLVNGSINMSRTFIPTHITNPHVDVRQKPRTFIPHQQSFSFNERP